MSTLPDAVTIRDVGPRDGLQPEEPVPVADRLSLVHALQDAGLRRIEVAAFVSPKAVPAMAGAAEVVAGIDRRPDVTYAALVPNRKGAELAIAADVDEITVTISASPTYNERNVRMTVDQSLDAIAEIVALASEASVQVDAVISCAFGSPYEADLGPADVSALEQRVLATGVAATTLADTTGMATPRRVDEVLDARPAAAPTPGLHLHDTRGTALLNAYRAMERGITRFDTALGGLGGSPFAHGAGGNLATEELVAVLDDLGIETGIDVEALVAATELVERLVGRAVPSGVAHAGPRASVASS